jgi:penicillin-binding protein 2
LATTEPARNALRLTFLSVVVLGLFLALFSRLWFLQVLAGDRYAELAEQNRMRPVVTEAPRGRILDRHDDELVKNRPALTVSADRSRILTSAGEVRSPEAQGVLDRLSHVLDMPEEDIVERLMSRRYSPFRAIPIKEDVTPEEVFQIKEHQELFPGVIVETLPVRTYPHETLAAHLVGYLGEITEEQLELEEFKDHRGGDLIGLAGLERTYEHHLRGQPGLTRYEVNANNVVLRELGRQEPEPGNDLRTSLDLEMQSEVERLLRDGMEASRSIQRASDGRFIRSTAGAVVVLDPNTGEVVAMASEPSYDPQVFVGGIQSEDWEWLNDEENDFPLLNRAMRGFPPGSVYKIVTGASALEAGLITPNQTLPCPPVWNLGNHPFRNWHRGHDGQMDAARALMRSCDPYYYELAYRQWQREERQRRAGDEVDEAMQRMAGEMGMGAPTGIDLPAESGGVIPGRAYKEELWERLKDVYCEGPPEGSGAYLRQLYREQCEDGWRWRGGDAVNMSIGQGDVLTTPLQMAVAYAAIANGGTVYRPRLGREIVDPTGEVVERFEPEVLGELPLEPDQLAAIQRGLRMVVAEPGGTANTPFAGFPIESAGKTGTAEFGDRIPFAWYVGYAPVDDPEYVVVGMVEQGGGGSQTAAPIVRRVMEALFGLEISEFRAGPVTD